MQGDQLFMVDLYLVEFYPLLSLFAQLIGRQYASFGMNVVSDFKWIL